MGVPRRARAILSTSIAVVALALVAGCADDGASSGSARSTTTTAETSTTAPPGADAAATGAGFPESWSPPKLDWNDCDVAQDAECATLAVPLDWSRPDGPHIDLALGRLRATGDHRIGSLLTNPGGPGGSGLEFLGYQPFSSQIRQQFDIVSWDPRGVGKSDGVTCGTGVPAFLSNDPDPDDAAEQDAIDADAKKVSAECARRDDNLLPHVGTPDVARDTEAIRRALHEDSVTFVGFSYGTSIAQQYAAFFPTRVRAMVLDGVVDPAATFTEFQFGQVRGFDAAFAAQAASCAQAGPKECGVDDLAAAYDEIHAKVEAHRIGSGADSVGPAELPVAAIYTAYASDGWRDLGPALAAARDGSGTELRRLADRYYDLGGYTSYAAVQCLDTPVPDGDAAFEAFVDQARQISPRFGGSVANELLPCATWPVRPADGRQSLGPLTAPGAPTILVIGNTGDPATPLANARAVADRLGSGHLLEVNVDGHTAYGLDACVTGVVDDYLVDPGRPITASTCN